MADPLPAVAAPSTLQGGAAVAGEKRALDSTAAAAAGSGRGSGLGGLGLRPRRRRTLRRANFSVLEQHDSSSFLLEAGDRRGSRCSPRDLAELYFRSPSK